MRLTCEVTSPEVTETIGEVIGHHLRAGDLVMLSGDLGAGKTTLTRGIGRAWGIEDEVASPTFIIARAHHVENGPNLVHVDAYRIGDLDDLETLDLATALIDSVVVVEWGEGKTETLSESRLTIHFTVDSGFDIDQAMRGELEAMDTGRRRIDIHGIGQRWDDEAVVRRLTAEIARVTAASGTTRTNAGREEASCD